MRRLFWSASAIVCCGILGRAENGTFALPVMEQSAVGAALGGGSAAFVSGVNALAVNPAGIPTSKKEINTQYQQLPLDVNLGGVAFVLPLGTGRSGFGVSYSSLRSSNFEKRSATGGEEGTFSHQDQLLGVHFGGPINTGSGNLSGGVSAKFIHSRVDSYSGTGAAVDGGLRYGFAGFPLTVAATALNLGQGPTLKEEASPLPTSYGLSGAYPIVKPLTIMAGAALFPNDDRSDLSLGAEYNVADRLALRGSYTLQAGPGKNTADLSGLAGGIGLTLGLGTFDYTFEPAAPDFDDAGGTHRVTLTLRF